MVYDKPISKLTDCVTGLSNSLVCSFSKGLGSGKPQTSWLTEYFSFPLKMMFIFRGIESICFRSISMLLSERLFFSSIARPLLYASPSLPLPQPPPSFAHLLLTAEPRHMAEPLGGLLGDPVNIVPGGERNTEPAFFKISIFGSEWIFCMNFGF